MKQIGASAIGVQGDVGNLADLDRLYQVIQERADRLDVLFANAGGGAFVPLSEITEAHFDKYAWLSCRCYNGGEPDNGKSPPAGSGRGLSTGFALVHSPWTPKQAVARHYAMIDKSDTRRRIDVVLERVGRGEDH